MVDINYTPHGDETHRHVGLNQHVWFAWFLLLCSLIALQPTDSRRVGATTKSNERIWLYQQDRVTDLVSESTVDVLVVGDIMLGRGVSGISDPFKRFSQDLNFADLTIGNYEGVISSASAIPYAQSELPGPTPFRLIAPIKAAAELQNAGFDLLSLANNHSLDIGVVGLKETIWRLESVGIKTVGVGENIETAYRPVIINIKGVRIAFLAIDAIPEPIQTNENKQGWVRAEWNKDRVLAAIRHADPISDVIIVLIHWGDEYELRAGVYQRQAALQMIEAGADAVIGSHPHVVQETQIIAKDDKGNAGFIAYSLGNFVFDQFTENSRIGLALKLYLTKTGLKAAEAIPISSGLSPEILAYSAARRLIERICPEPLWLSFQCTTSTCYAVQNPSKPASGLFKSGRIDLKGDGIPEIIRLENGKVSIYEGGQLEWESPQEWQVLDAVLGDPNDDGRGEIVLIVQKPDKNGILTSHPFVIGYRGGIYRQLWGGSAVAIPIKEVELADIDGDGKQELIVLEEQKDGMNTIALWRWDDWVFRLIWRSAPGRFVNLQVHQDAENEKIIMIGQIR